MKKEEFLVGLFVAVSLTVASVQDFLARKVSKKRSMTKLR